MRNSRSRDPEVEAYLKEDRQWPRRLRIAHAKAHLEAGMDRKFWVAVIKANGGKVG
jgi:hypothetical protein